MTQDLNLRVNVWRMNTSGDDEVGGASITGTVVYTMPGAIAARRPTQASLEQGLEVEAIYDATVKLCGVTIYERDELQVDCPPSHPLYGLRFRVLGVQPAKRRQGAEQHLTLSRIRQSRRQQ